MIPFAFLLGFLPIVFIFLMLLSKQPRVAVVFGLLLLAFPFSIHWTDALRGYGLACLMLLCFLYFIKASRTDRFVQKWQFAVLFGCLSCLSSYQATPFVLVGIAISGIWILYKKRREFIFKIVGGSAIVIIPIVLHIALLKANGEVFKSMRIDGLSPLMIWDRFTWTNSQNGYKGVWAVSIALIFISYSLCLKALRKKNIENEILDIIYLIAGLAGSFLLLLQSKYLPYEWHFVIPAYFLFFQLATLWEKTVRPGKIEKIVIITMLVVAVSNVPNAMVYLSKRFTNVNLIANYLMNKTEESDLIIVNPWELSISLSHYYLGKAELLSVPPLSNYNTHQADDVTRFMQQDPAPFFSALNKRVSETLKNGHSVWLVGYLALPTLGTSPYFVKPAPNQISGWAGAPYYRMWTENLGVILLSTAENGCELTPEYDSNYSYLPYEHERTFQFKGIKTP
jgi:hypothetical protein